MVRRDISFNLKTTFLNIFTALNAQKGGLNVEKSRRKFHYSNISKTPLIKSRATVSFIILHTNDDIYIITLPASII